ncbi:unnamed protein product, partial [Symbiodinium sp. KB8]
MDLFVGMSGVVIQVGDRHEVAVPEAWWLRLDSSEPKEKFIKQMLESINLQNGKPGAVFISSCECTAPPEEYAVDESEKGSAEKASSSKGEKVEE